MIPLNSVEPSSVKQIKNAPRDEVTLREIKERTQILHACQKVGQK